MGAGAEQLEEVDRCIGEFASDAFAFLERLVAAPSTVGNEAQAQEIVAAELESIGLAVRQIEIPQSITTHPASGVAQLPYDGRRDVFATTGPGTLDLLLNGHIDVVPASSSRWQTDPFSPRTVGGWMIGRGTGDMKGGFAMAALALRGLRAATPESLERPLGMVSVIEEECTGNGTLSSVLAGVESRVVVLPEPTDLGILLAGVGILWVDIQLLGDGGHALEADEVVNPLDLMPDLIASLEDLANEWSEQFTDEAIDVSHPYNVNVGTVSSGDWPSSVPTRVQLGVRVGHPRRLNANDVFDTVCQRLEKLGRERAPGVIVNMRQSGFRAEGYALDKSSPLVALVAQCHETSCGVAPAFHGLGSTTDARYYVNQLGIPALCYGPVAHNIHGAEERVLLSSIVDGARTLARFIMRLDELTEDDAARLGAEGKSR